MNAPNVQTAIVPREAAPPARKPPFPDRPGAGWRLERWWRAVVGKAASALLQVAPLLSPTWRLAVWRKSLQDGAGRTRFIRAANCRYLAVGAALAIATFCATGNVSGSVDWGRWWPALVILAWYLLSRCNEIFFAFYRDAFDKLDRGARPSSALTWPTRVRLALNSYVELVLKFAVLYALLPGDMWQGGAQRPTSFTDLLSYSALTITTSGGGGFAAKHWLAQLLTSYEVICGLILLVVSFTIYVGRGLAEVCEVLELVRHGSPVRSPVGAA